MRREEVAAELRRIAGRLSLIANATPRRWYGARLTAAEAADSLIEREVTRLASEALRASAAIESALTVKRVRPMARRIQTT